MNNKLLTFFFLLISGLLFSQGGIKGIVINEDGEKVPQADAYIKSLSKGTTTNNDGSFEITKIPNGTYTLTISFLGYANFTKEVIINNQIVDLGIIKLKSSSQMMDEIVMSGSRRLEKITESPATINVITAKQIDNFAGSPSELFAQQKGVDFVRTGAFISGFNVRGFNSAFNPKMLQLDDNRYSTLIATGLAYGPLSPIIKEDIERVEVVLGPSSALYGPNAHNGLVNTVTKSPFKYDNTEIVIGGGSNSLFSGRFRHAKKLSDKIAYKLTGEYTTGKEINWTDSVYVAGKGYPELQLDRDVNFLKGGAAAYYKPTSSSEIGVVAGSSKSNYISVTNAGRNQIKDWKISFLQGTYTSKRLFAQIYKTWSNTDSTFSINRRTQNYLALIAAGQSEQQALKGSYGGAISPLFIDKSKRLNGEIQYNNKFGDFDFIIGAQIQKDEADSRQTYLIDADGPIKINQKGFYGQFQYAFGDSGVKLIFAARGDDHDLFGFNFIPKGGITYTRDKGTWRLTYGKGISTPTILNTNMNLFGGIILGNGEGFTLSDNTKIKPLEPETIQTIEFGYKGSLAENKLYLDVNAYYNMSDNFISPLTQIAPLGLAGGPVVTYRGDKPITDFTGGLAPGVYDPGAYILTYLNFGQVDTYGADLGINYYFNDNINIGFNYSFFDYSLDKNDMDNDGNGDGKVSILDLPINTPKHKMSATLNYSKDKFYGTILTRWVQKYDFFSGRNVAAETNTDIVIGGDPVVENQRVGTQFNYGQLGGFFVNLNAGYNINDHFSIGAYVVNLVGTGNYEFVASPPSETLIGAELKIRL